MYHFYQQHKSYQAQEKIFRITDSLVVYLCPQFTIWHVAYSATFEGVFSSYQQVLSSLVIRWTKHVLCG